MNHPNWIYSVSIAVLCAYGATMSHAAQNAPTFMSKDGQIQSVNKYSSNPFWSPNSPYNQRIPTPIYATGPDLTTGDCNTVVKTLVASHCAARNNCADLRISDVRPNIMVQLSQLPGHSYATSCGGYIDSAFENYKKTYGNTSAVNIVYSGNNNKNTTLRLTPATYTPTESESRAAELERLQKETTPDAGIDATLFPKTVDDLSFTDRLANTTAGYEPYKNKSSYVTPMFETESEYYDRMKTVLEHQITYVNAGTATGCPKTYLTGRGTTVSCVPTRDPRSEFVAWCMDAKLTNCAQEYIISPTDRDDKVFYAKWDCINNSVKRGDKCECSDPHMNAYCECTGIWKTDPSDAKRCACVNGEDPANNCGTPQITPPTPPSGGCTDPTYMDSNCQCTVVPNTHIDTATGKCACNNGKDISNNCEDGTPPPPTNIQCLTNVENDPNFKSMMTTNLTGVTDLTNWINTNKTSFYSLLANKVVEHCLQGSASDITEFNALLDSSAVISVSVDFNGTPTPVSVDKFELFDYTSYWTYPIIINHSGVKNVGTGMPKSAAVLPTYVQECTGTFYTSRTGGPAGGWANPTIEKAARGVYPKPRGNGFLIGKVSFPGMLYNFHQSFASGASLTQTKNYAQAREQIKQFVNNINSDGGCSGNNMVVYLVSEATPDENNATSVKIMSEPFVIR